MPDIPGIALKVFKSLADATINVDMIVQSNPKGDRNDISFTVGLEDRKNGYGPNGRIKGKIRRRRGNLKGELG